MGRLRRWLAILGIDAVRLLARLSGRARPYERLVVDLAGDIPEEPVAEGWLRALLGREETAWADLLLALDWAREDPQVATVLVRVRGLAIGWGRVAELRAALSALRAAGKAVWVVLHGGGLREYVLATAGSRIVLPPSATLDITGLAAEVTFLGEACERLGIVAEVAQVGRYKSAAEALTRRGMSAEHREMLESLVGDLYSQAVQAIATSRGIAPERVRELIDRAPLLAREAEEAGLVDAVGYEDELGEPGAGAGDGRRLEIDASRYRRQRGRQVRRRALAAATPAIGLLTLSGTISARGGLAAAAGFGVAGAPRLGRELKRMSEAPELGAIVLRVASPGGSALGSDLLWREVKRAAARKPLIASLGDTAASGGYYVAMGARRVIATGGTLTGSIGVLAGKIVLRGLYERLGLAKELVGRGRHAGLRSDYLPLSAEERARLEETARACYREFVVKAALCRGLGESEAEQYAEGRVWSGRQARERGLVDGLGGMAEAIEQAKEAAGIARGAPAVVVRYPRPRRWQVPLRSPLPVGAETVTAAAGDLAGLAALAGEGARAPQGFALRFL